MNPFVRVIKRVSVEMEELQPNIVKKIGKPHSVEEKTFKRKVKNFFLKFNELLEPNLNLT